MRYRSAALKTTDLLNALNDLKGWLFEDAGTLVSAISVFLALLVLFETVKLRRIETDPEITIFLEQMPGSFSIIELVVKNIGRGQAYGISFDVDPDNPFWQDWKLTSMTMFAKGLDHMAPGQEIRVLIGTYVEVRKEPFTVTTTYKGMERRLGKPRAFKESYVIDVRQFHGRFHMGGDIEAETLQAIKKIAAATESISKGVARAAAAQSLHQGRERLTTDKTARGDETATGDER